jgi:hypothetical protein
MSRIETMLETFDQLYRSGAPFREDAALGAELAREARPVLEALVQASAEPRAAGGRHEVYAWINLLGRRAGSLGATPSAALHLLAALGGALSAGGAGPAEDLRAELAMVLMEGYCAGRDERVTQELRLDLSRAQASFLLAPRCRCVLLSGTLESEVLERVLEGVARELLHDDALSCLIDATRMRCAPGEHAPRALVDFLLTCRSLGVCPVLAGASPEVLRGIEVWASGREPELARDFPEALRLALARASQELRPARAGLRRLLFGGR